MKFSITAALLSLASFASAEEFRVVVGQDKDGKGALVYTPDQVTAKVGDQIHFEFHAKNHTVTQSSFAEPCTRQRNITTNELGVDSGFMPVAPDAKEVPVWIIEIKQDTSPIWMFCNQGNHCNQGMVFAINAKPDGDKTFAAYKEKAKTANHPKPEDNITPDPNAPAPPAGSSAPAPSAAPTESNSSPAPSAPEASSPAASGPVQPSSARTVTPTADQANANVSAAPSSSNQPSGAFSAVRIPTPGFALTLAGLLAGMLL